MADATPWEQGSDLHTMELSGPAQWPWGNRPVTLAASGREALRQLVVHLAPQVVRLPDFYCEDVVPPLRALGVTVQWYRDDPREPASEIDAGPGDLVIRVNTWGLRAAPAG